MANRVVAADVKKIIRIDSSISDDDLDTGFIVAANLLTTNVCTSSNLDTATLKEIERWLSAHFAAIDDMRLARETIGDATNVFQHKVDLKLNATMYGQQAMMLDHSNALSALNEGKRKSEIRHIDVLA